MSGTPPPAAGGSYEGVFHFKLSEKCNVFDIRQQPNIELDIKDEEDGTKSVVTFKVKVKNAGTEEEALNIARTRAKRLVDILAVYSGKHLGYFLTGGQTTQKATAATTTPVTDRKGKVSNTFIGKYDKDSGKPLDLNKGNIVQAINTRNPPNKDLTFLESLSYANEGLGAHANDLYQVMIKQFYLALGDRQEARKYDCLRDVLSHHQLNDDTKQCVEHDFPGMFDWTNYNTLNYGSEKTRQSLRKIAWNIMKEAQSHTRPALVEKSHS
ncbi:MAG TPA: hypothetical protein VJ695_02885 [Nitrososphaera sp.]|nr:hypothetical protein [Nitrososphaera sp.]